MVDNFFQEYQYTFSAIGAIGSMGAVIVSLWYSYAAHNQNTKVRIKCILKYCANIFTNSNKSHYLIQLDVVNNSFFEVCINIGVGMRYGRGKNYLQMLPTALSSTIQEYQLTNNIITLNRGESKSVVFAYDDNLSNLLKDFNNNIVSSNNALAKYNFFGKFGNKLYLELTDGTKIKIDNHIPKYVPN
jgi:hypothetical protein